jgi:hypothetical protein
MKNEGKAGCGCLIFILVICMVAIGILVHPFTLKLIGAQFEYEDKIFPSDAAFVPRFTEDRNGELYTEAFQEYRKGNARAIIIEDDKLFGVSLLDLVQKMAKTHGIKEAAVKGLNVEGEGKVRVDQAKEQFQKMGFKKVIILVPEHASRRFHMLYGSSGEDGKVLYLIKPVAVSYFTKHKWWKSGRARGLLLKEACLIGLYQLERFKYGDRKK